jgi:hypothetical protein
LVLTALIVIVIFALFFSWSTNSKKTNRRRRNDDTEPILEDLFKGKSIEEIEKEVENEYGVKIEIQHVEDEDYKAWRDLSNQNFLKAYGQDEPEYNINDIKEPNPLYKSKWKEK